METEFLYYFSIQSDFTIGVMGRTDAEVWKLNGPNYKGLEGRKEGKPGNQ